MGICAKELRHYVVRPTLKHLRMWSPTAENLLLGTAARESGLGFHLKQEHQQALGIYQISPRMHRNIWDHYLAKKSDLSSLIRGLASQREFLAHPHLELATNLSYATAIAWMIYYRTEKPIHKVPHDDIPAMGKLWHNYYHRHHPGPVESFVESYRTLITDSVESGQALSESLKTP
ncbi:hypothetical protein [Endozoicomonas arenosclerae]|uniref:hypothetical protein n=1 Tax=Endozoicomonas arenosclerae TaxID=1633495 RepID=UPI0007865CA5|nr:hypothetical protein [Endozoicomonas arenosclerae]